VSGTIGAKLCFDGQWGTVLREGVVFKNRKVVGRQVGGFQVGKAGEEGRLLDGKRLVHSMQNETGSEQEKEGILKRALKSPSCSSDSKGPRSSVGYKKTSKSNGSSRYVFVKKELYQKKNGEVQRYIMKT